MAGGLCLSRRRGADADRGARRARAAGGDPPQGTASPGRPLRARLPRRGGAGGGGAQRIGALAQTHELLSQSKWEGADILCLVLDELAPYHSDGRQRVSAVGPSLVLAPEQAQLVAMAVHELATNAAKYGSLSVELGKVDVSWSAFENVLTLVWRESGGPRVTAPKKPGFGTKIISSLGGSHRGRTDFKWLPDGLTFTLELRFQDDAAAQARLPVTADQPIRTGMQPAAPPQTMFWAVRRLSSIV